MIRNIHYILILMILNAFCIHRLEAQDENKDVEQKKKKTDLEELLAALDSDYSISINKLERLERDKNWVDDGRTLKRRDKPGIRINYSVLKGNANKNDHTDWRLKIDALEKPRVDPHEEKYKDKKKYLSYHDLIYWETKLVETSMLVLSDGVHMATYSVGKNSTDIMWARKIRFDHELVTFNDKSPEERKPQAMVKEWRKKRDLFKENNKVPSKLNEPSYNVCRINSNQILVAVLFLSNLRIYLVGKEWGQYLSCRKIYYDFSPLDVFTEEEVSTSYKCLDKAKVLDKNDSCIIIGSKNRSYVIIVTRRYYCIYLVNTLIHENMSFIGRYRKEK